MEDNKIIELYLHRSEQAIWESSSKYGSYGLEAVILTHGKRNGFGLTYSVFLPSPFGVEIEKEQLL